MANTDVTPNRKTHVRFDVAEPVLSEQPFSLERLHHHMARGKAARLSHVLLRRRVGWTLESYNDENQFVAERTEGQSGILTVDAGTLAVAPLINKHFGHRALTELSGALTGADPNYATQGQPFYRKDVPAGTDWDTAVLSADQAAFPSPDTTEDTLKMDRVAVSTAAYGIGTPKYNYHFIPLGAIHARPHALTTFYFPGPAGEDDQGKGKGQYALKFYGSGIAKLYERSTSDTWLERAVMSYCAPDLVVGYEHTVTVFYIADPSMMGGPNGTIEFAFGNTNLDPANEPYGVGPLAALKDAIVSRGKAQSSFTYSVPKITRDNLPTWDCPLRVDVRRDLRMRFNIGVPYFFGSGTLIDDAFSIMRPVSETSNFSLQWDAYTPDGTTVTLELLDAETDTELAILSSGDNYKFYDNPAWPKTDFYIRATLATTDDTKTPVLRAWKVIRDPTTRVIDNGEWDLPGPRSITITGAERDMSHESATIESSDLTNSAETLRVRTNRPIVIETEYDPLDPSKRVQLFRGYAQRVKSRRRGRAGSVYPNENWNDFVIDAGGMWQRLHELTCMNVHQDLWDYTAGLPLKVTYVIRSMLTWAGFTAEMIDIPDADVRVWGSGSNDYTVLEPTANLGETIQDLAKTFLGHFLFFDPNVGTYGKIRAKLPPTAPYTNEAAFITSGPTGAGKRIVHNINAYSLASTLGDGLTYTATAPSTFIVKDTMQTQVKPPEGNYVKVCCIGLPGSQGTNSKFESAPCWNPKSFDLYPDVPTADPDHPDYLGRFLPIYVIDPALMGVADSDDAIHAALNWFARRIYDVACHAVKLVTFQAPLIFIEHEDDATRKRPLRYYDPVSVNGQQFLVRNVNPAYTKDKVQMAMYELEAPRF